MIEDFTIICPKCERYLKPGRKGLVCRYCNLQFNHLGEKEGKMSIKRNYKPHSKFVFKANEYLTLKLEHNQTFIYVRGKRFLQCIRLVLNINQDSMEVYDEIGSIDEAEEVYKNTLYQNRIVTGPMARPTRNQEHTISAQQEFWGHCSNIQAWVENDYDTRILYRNMAFPLLKELMIAGDPKAKIVFKEEIAIRFESGYPNVVKYLLTEGYLSYFNKEELNVLFENPKLLEKAFKDRNLFYTLQPFLRNIPNLSKKLVSFLKANKNHFTFRELLQNGYLNFVDIDVWDLILDIKEYLTNILKDPSLLFTLIKNNPQVIKNLLIYIMNNTQWKASQVINEIKKRESYKLSGVIREIIHDYENRLLNPKISKFIEAKFDDLFLNNLQRNDIKLLLKNSKSILHKRYIRFNKQIFLIKNNELDLSDYKIRDLRSVEYLSSHTEIIKLNLDNNQLTNINGIENFTNLEELSLRNNRITELKDIASLVNLKILRLEENKISEIKSLETLTNLTVLTLEGNKITEIKGVDKLKKLKSLNLSRNKIKEIGNLKNLTKLETLDLAFNKIIELNYSKLPHARRIYLESNPIMNIVNQKKEHRSKGMRVISFPVNRHIKVELENNNIQIYVDEELSVQLVVNKENIQVYEGYKSRKSKTPYVVRYLEKDTDSKIFPGFGTIEVASEIDQKYMKSVISLNKMYPFIFNEKVEEDKVIHTKFMQFCMKLQLWNEYNYDPRLIQKNIAIPILRKLAALGDKDAQRILKDEVKEKKIITLQNIRGRVDPIDYEDNDKYGIV
ncbi:MAG: leucine-rich repeat domain-containing protein [Promethearchaeota archaeon]